MKRKVLCVFSLILFLLIFCTFLSMKIEVEMLTQVEVKTIKDSQIYFGDIELPISVLFKDEYQSHLYEVVEGTGWESGMRIQEIASQQYQVSEETQLVTLSPGQDYSFVLTASRKPSYGELVEIVEDTQTAPDTYLVYYPTGVSEYESIPEAYKLLAQSENALLLAVEKGTFPYFEHRAKNKLREIATSDMRVFSLTAVERLLENLPMLAVLLLMLLVPVILWGYSCFQSRNYSENRVILLINTGIAVVLLCCMPSVLTAIDLPASMLPGDNILEFDHYSREFSIVFGALKILGESVKGTLTMAGAIWKNSLGIFFAGLFCAILVIFIETAITNRRKQHRLRIKRKVKYVGKYVK